MNKEVLTVVVCFGARVSAFVQDVFEGEGVKVYRTMIINTSHEVSWLLYIPYFRASTLITSQLMPHTLIHLTFTQDSLSELLSSLNICTKRALSIFPKLLLTVL
jgi:hypothetical protein